MSIEVKMLKVSEVAALFRVNSKTVYRWRDEGLLPHRRTPGNGTLFPEEHVMRLLGLDPQTEQSKTLHPATL